MRRKPRRTRAWSSTRSTETLSRMRYQLFSGHSQSNQHAALRWTSELDPACEQFCPFPHRHQSDPLSSFLHLESGTVIFNLNFQRFRQKSETYPRFIGARMPGNIVKCFLQYSIHVDCRIPINANWFTSFFIGYVKTLLSFHHQQLPVERGSEPRFIWHQRVQPLGQP